MHIRLFAQMREAAGHGHRQTGLQQSLVALGQREVYIDRIKLLQCDHCVARIQVLTKIDLPADEAEIEDLVERLMGKKAEARFQFIQDNALSVANLDV